jgi:hypothetical protein
MKLVQMRDDLYEYLVYVVESHATRGLPPNECLAMHQLWEHVTKGVTHIDDAKLAAAEATVTVPQQTQPEFQVKIPESGM